MADGDSSKQTRSGLDLHVNAPTAGICGNLCCRTDEYEEHPWQCRAMPVCGMTPRLEVPTPRHYESFEFRPCEDLLGPDTEPIGSPVVLHLYDLNPKLAAVNRVTYDLLGAGGAFHASIEVCGIEWSFGSRGINRSLPRQRWQELYRQSVTIGRTSCSKSDVALIIKDMESEGWTQDDYDVLQKNCGSFADKFCVRLDVGHIPAWVNRFAEASASNGAWRKLANYLGCESAEGQLDGQSHPHQKRSGQSGAQAGYGKKHPVPRLAISNLRDSLSPDNSPTGLKKASECPLADRTNRLPNSFSRSPTKKHPSPQQKGRTPSKQFLGRRCKAFAYEYDPQTLSCDLNRDDSVECIDDFKYARENIVWHN